MTQPTFDLRRDVPRYVAEALKATTGRWLTRDELAESYDPPKPNDMTEIKAELRHGWGGRVDDDDVKAELVFDALDEINRNNSGAIVCQTEHDYDSGVALADGVDPDTLTDELGRPLIRSERVLPDLFTPGGAWHENIRTFSEAGLKELRESMEQLGWLRQLPAIVDENGVCIVGHRRLAVADELGIEPVVQTIRFGEGDAADAKRAALAIASNVGAEKISPADRKKIAADLYGQGWSMAKIGELLKVATMTVSRDLRGFNRVLNSPDQPKRGRPRKEPKPTPAPTPPGGVTASTPGMSPAVSEALDKARKTEAEPPASEPAKPDTPAPKYRPKTPEEVRREASDLWDDLDRICTKLIEAINRISGQNETDTITLTMTVAEARKIHRNLIDAAEYVEVLL